MTPEPFTLEHAREIVDAIVARRKIPEAWITGPERDAIAQAAVDAAAATNEGPDGFTSYKLNAYTKALQEGVAPLLDRQREEKAAAALREHILDRIDCKPGPLEINREPVRWGARAVPYWFKPAPTPPDMNVWPEKHETLFDDAAPRAFDAKRIMRDALAEWFHKSSTDPTPDRFIGEMMRLSGGALNPHDLRRLADLLFDGE